jgi:hypothetical protein
MIFSASLSFALVMSSWSDVFSARNALASEAFVKYSLRFMLFNDSRKPGSGYYYDVSRLIYGYIDNGTTGLQLCLNRALETSKEAFLR